MDIKAELRSMIEVWGADFVDKAVVALAEIERLEAEVARLSEAVFRQDAAWQATAASLRAERDALRASNERMEAALRLLSDSFTTGWAGDLTRHEVVRKVERIASEALSAQPVEPDAEREHRRAMAIYDSEWKRGPDGQPYPDQFAMAMETVRIIAESDKKARKS